MYNETGDSHNIGYDSSVRGLQIIPGSAAACASWFGVSVALSKTPWLTGQPGCCVTEGRVAELGFSKPETNEHWLSGKSPQTYLVILQTT